MTEEELAAARLRTAGGDAERAALEAQRAVLVGERPAGAAVAVASGVAALHDEVGDDAVECQAVVEPSLAQSGKRRGSERRGIAAEIDDQIARAGAQAQETRLGPLARLGRDRRGGRRSGHFVHFADGAV